MILVYQTFLAELTEALEERDSMLPIGVLRSIQDGPCLVSVGWRCLSVREFRGNGGDRGWMLVRNVYIAQVAGYIRDMVQY
jgi:hypothetical protein